MVTPYYNKATQKGLIEHFTAIAKSVSLPIIMYNVPGRTGCNMLPQTVAALVNNVDNIVGIKEASANIAQVADIMSLTNGNIDNPGCDEMIVPYYRLVEFISFCLMLHLPDYDMVAKYLEEIQIQAASCR